MNRFVPVWLRVLVFVARLVAPGPTWAQTDEITVFNGEISPPGGALLTVHNNYTPIGRDQPAFPGGVVPNHSLNGSFEWAYGVTDFLELGAHMPIYTVTNQGTPQFDGGAFRTLFVVPHAHDRTFFYGVNFEWGVSTEHWDDHRVALEIRPIAGWHLGRWDVILNPIIDTELNGAGNAHFAPAERIAYNWSKTWAFAVEHYADFGPFREFEQAARQFHEIFGVVDYQFNPADSVEFGVGHGLTNASDRLILKLMINHAF